MITGGGNRSSNLVSTLLTAQYAAHGAIDKRWMAMITFPANSNGSLPKPMTYIQAAHQITQKLCAMDKVCAMSGTLGFDQGRPTVDWVMKFLDVREVQMDDDSITFQLWAVCSLTGRDFRIPNAESCNFDRQNNNHNHSNQNILPALAGPNKMRKDLPLQQLADDCFDIMVSLSTPQLARTSGDGVVTEPYFPGGTLGGFIDRGLDLVNELKRAYPEYATRCCSACKGPCGTAYCTSCGYEQ
jgi:hypothetical protein